MLYTQNYDVCDLSTSWRQKSIICVGPYQNPFVRPIERQKSEAGARTLTVRISPREKCSECARFLIRLSRTMYTYVHKILLI